MVGPLEHVEEGLGDVRQHFWKFMAFLFWRSFGGTERPWFGGSGSWEGL